MFETILVLAEKADFVKQDNIHYAINSFSQIQRMPSGVNVHLKIDTGMHRNGINPRELQDALDLILSNSLRLRGVFSHLKSGDELGSQSFWQEQCFKDIKKSVITYCDGRNVVRPLFHLYNSAYCTSVQQNFINAYRKPCRSGRTADNPPVSGMFLRSSCPRAAVHPDSSVLGRS